MAMRVLAKYFAKLIVFKLTRMRKISAGSDLQHDVRQIFTYMHTDKFHSKLVYVGLVQARPNYNARHLLHNLHALVIHQQLDAIVESWLSRYCSC